jgi:putative nucleotidyltransferase with HDIG domain
MHTQEEIIGILDQVSTLPTIPLVIQKISEVVRDPSSDARSVARVIEDDPAIMARILKVVNSALYSSDIEIDSVSQAVARMGMVAVNNLALSTTVFSMFSENDDVAFDRQEFWRHSICTGIASCVIQNRAKSALKTRHLPETLRLAGLLHDIGKVVMEQYLFTEFHEAVDAARKRPAPLYQVEQELVGADHAYIGAWLAKKWGLGEELVQVIRWHHDPESASEEHREKVILCHVANYICNQQKLGDGGDLEMPILVQHLWKKLGLSVADISSIMDEILEESRKSEILLAFA